MAKKSGGKVSNFGGKKAPPFKKSSPKTKAAAKKGGRKSK